MIPLEIEHQEAKLEAISPSLCPARLDSDSSDVLVQVMLSEFLAQHLWGANTVSVMGGSI